MMENNSRQLKRKCGLTDGADGHLRQRNEPGVHLDKPYKREEEIGKACNRVQGAGMGLFPVDASRWLASRTKVK